MTYDTILLEKKGPLATLTLNRPDKLNAVSYELLMETAAAMDELNEEADVRVVVIRGAGRAFSSGTDLQSLGSGRIDRSRPGYRYHLTRLQEAFCRIERLEKPVIAQVHGYALGAAMELMLACDFRITAADAQMGLPEVLYGIVPDLGGCQRLARTVGLPRAKELVMTGRRIGGEEAERIGLVHRAVPPEDLEAEVQAWCEEFLKLPPLAVGLAKRVVDKSLDTDLVTSLDANAQVQSMLLRTEDFQEAVGAKLEKRDPVFKGK